MTVRIRIDENTFDGASPMAMAIDRLPAGSSEWVPVGLYGVRDREIEVDVEPGDRLRAAGASPARVPHGAPAGLTALILSDWIEIPLG
jgi:hypothetical protein